MTMADTLFLFMSGMVVGVGLVLFGAVLYREMGAKHA